MSVLVAEDDPAGVELMETVLHGLGIENIIIAESGTEALKAFDEFQASIGLIKSDWNMPGLTGGQLFEEVRAERENILRPQKNLAHIQALRNRSQKME